jgi:hypothetical protein
MKLATISATLSAAKIAALTAGTYTVESVPGSIMFYTLRDAAGEYYTVSDFGTCDCAGFVANNVCEHTIILSDYLVHQNELIALEIAAIAHYEMQWGQEVMEADRESRTFHTLSGGKKGGR